MRLTKLDDYQSWMISERDTHVLVDPWLTEPLTHALGAWLFARSRTESPVAPSALPPPSAILISSDEDVHLSPATLSCFDRTTPIHAPHAAARRLRALGFSSVRTYVGGATFDVAAQLRVTTITPGFPYARSALGFLVESRETEARIYLEAHTTAEGGLTAIPAGLDALICPCESMFSGLVQRSMDAERTARTIARLRPKRFLPTGVEPGRSAGLLGRHGRRISGTIADLERILVERRLETKLVSPRTGESISLV